MLDELVDLDEERLKALNALFRQKEKVAKAYNKKVKAKAFSVGDMVWRLPYSWIERTKFWVSDILIGRVNFELFKCFRTTHEI